MTSKILIIGAGAAGFFAAIHHAIAHPNDSVILAEKGKEVLRKVKISGGGRCNVTHACFDPKQLTEYYPRGNKELRGPFQQFQPQDTIAWFEKRGVKLKTEVDGRMFPVTDSSQTIIDCLQDSAKKAGIKLWTQCGVSSLSSHPEGIKAQLDNGDQHLCKKVILATGSSPAGHALATSLGHRIIDPVPSLFTFKISDKNLHKLSGLSVSKTEVRLTLAKKRSQIGPTLITHWGVSGPGIIKLSAWQARELYDCGYQTGLIVDWLPDYSTQDLIEKMHAQQHKSPRKKIEGSSPFAEIPQRLWAYLLQKMGLSESLVWQNTQQKQHERISIMLKACDFLVAGKGVFKEEFVTCGGVSNKEINFKTMESKLVPGFHVIGEALDIDGVTGGFNFQNAWTTGYLAGVSS